MKHILSTLTVLFTLLTSTISWGGVEGKGIWCKSNFETVNDSRYLFKRNGVTRYEFSVTKNDKYEIKETLYDGGYRVSVGFIFWSNPPFNYSLNRKTLTLVRVIGDIESIYSCEVYSQKDFLEKVKKEKEQLQSEYDKKTKDNKI